MKRALTIIGIILLSVLLLTGILIGVLHMKSVQTYLIGQVTELLTKDMQVEMHISQFHYRPLSHLMIDDVYLSDQQKDTLAYIEQIELNFHPLRLRHKQLDIDQLTLKNPYLNIHHLPDSSLNCQFILSAFQKDSSTFPLQVSIQQLSLEQTRLRYNDLLVDQLDLALTVPILSSDSLDFYIASMHMRAQLDKFDATFEANLHGGLDSIFADDLELEYRGKQVFKGNVGIHHPTNINSLRMNANCELLHIDTLLFTNILSQLPDLSIKLPTPIANLEYIDYVGNITGNLNDLKLNGSFLTSQGSININGTFQYANTEKKLAFSTQIATDSFHLGKTLANKDFGEIIFDATINGTLDSTRTFFGNSDIHIQQFYYKNYIYNDINIGVRLDTHEMHIDKFFINDENINLSIVALAESEDEHVHTNFDIRVKHIAPNALHLIKEFPELSASTNINIDFYWDSREQDILDAIEGYIILDSIQIHNGDKHLANTSLKLFIDREIEDSDTIRSVRIQSNYIRGKVKGKYSFRTLPIAIQYLLHYNLPTLVKKPQQAYPEDIQIRTTEDCYLYLIKVEPINRVLGLSNKIPPLATLRGYINHQQMGFYLAIHTLETSSTTFKDIAADFLCNSDKLDLKLKVTTHLPKDNPTTAKIGNIGTTFHIFAKNDSVDLDVTLGNTNPLVRNSGELSLSAQLSEYLDKPKVDIHINPTNLTLNDSVWEISPTNITYTHATQCADVSDFLLRTNYQSIYANGRVSKSKEDSLNIALNNINLNYILSYTEANKAISIEGPVTGTATLYSILSEMMLEAQANIKEAHINGVYIGDANAQAQLDRTNQCILIDGIITDSTQHQVAQVNGKVIPANKQWLLDIDCDSVDIAFIDFWTKDIMANPKGRAYGQIRVEGVEHLVNVTGKALAKNAQITLPQTGVTYYFSDSVYLDDNAIRFPKIDIRDNNNKTGSFEGTVYHNYFTGFNFDLTANANNMLVMDLPEEQQALFYGKVFATGDVHIYGDELDCKIDVNAKTEANTKFFLNINSASQATSTSFIDFVQPDTISHYLLNFRPKEVPVNEPLASKLRLNLKNVEVTRQADICIKLGAEDNIRGYGEGNLNLVYEAPSNNVQMQGTYTMHSGQFAFSLGNIVRRNFVIREGSRITWDGDPLSPTLDITGHYHTTASLRDLFGSESSQIATDRTSVPVNCVLQMKDQLFNPILEFAIELPQSDESVQSQVRSMINTDEMLMRQIIYILVFNRFYTPEYLQNTQNVGVNETFSLLSSTLTGQINSWLSKLTDVFTMGFEFRTDGEGETASQEYEANFQLHPINQLIINGNFGYRYNDLSNRPFFGDLDIEYLLTENGKFRVKAYTHTVDKYSLRQANTVQGVGLVFKHDFNWKKPKKDKDKKEIGKENKQNKKNSQKTIE